MKRKRIRHFCPICRELMPLVALDAWHEIYRCCCGEEDTVRR